jgi:hypothetical protein
MGHVSVIGYGYSRDGIILRPLYIVFYPYGSVKGAELAVDMERNPHYLLSFC